MGLNASCPLSIDGTLQKQNFGAEIKARPDPHNAVGNSVARLQRLMERTAPPCQPGVL
jgi:hypothetical protein